MLLVQGVDSSSVEPRGPRRHDERARDRAVEGLDKVPGATLTRRDDEPGALELLQVVVDLLAGLAETPGDRRSGGGLAQRVEDLDPQRMQQHLEVIELADDVHSVAVHSWVGDPVRGHGHPP